MSASESRRVPSDQIESVVKSLYAAADRLDWEHLTANARTAQYDEWVNAPEIGGALTGYMSSENARSWIKDGPMKEYARARLGAGRYARFGSTNGPTADQLVAHVLGNEAELVEDSAGIKPFHCQGTAVGKTVYISWGPARNLRHLVWACINHLATYPTHEACVVILESLEHPTTQAAKARHDQIARQCSITFKYLRVSALRQTSPAGDTP